MYKANANKFFDGGHTGKADPENTIGNKFQNVQSRMVPVNMEGERFKRD